MDINPCTHHAITPYIQATGGGAGKWYLKLAFYNSDGGKVGTTYTIRELGNLPGGNQNTNCGGSSCAGIGGEVCTCGQATGTNCGPAGCLRVFTRVHASARYIPSTGRCRVALAFDNWIPASNGFNYTKAQMDIVDITNEWAPFLVKGWISRTWFNPGNDFESVASISRFGSGAGWFWYRQAVGNACSTTFVGATDPASYGYGSIGLLGPFTSAFPTMSILGDYVEDIPGGLPGGYLYPSWTEPVVTSSPPSAACPTCFGAARSLRVMGVRVAP